MRKIPCEICGKLSDCDGVIWWSCDCHKQTPLIKIIPNKEKIEKEVLTNDDIQGFPI